MGGRIEKSVKDKNGEMVFEEKRAIGTVLVEYEQTAITPIDENYRKVGEKYEESGFSIPDIGGKTKVLIGVEWSLNLNTVWDALGKLLNEK